MPDALQHLELCNTPNCAYPAVSTAKFQVEKGLLSDTCALLLEPGVALPAG